MFYVVGTPIGNLRDLSLRQAEIIMSSDYLLCEDTRKAGLLKLKIVELFLLKTNPSQKLISYYREKEFEKLPEVMGYIEEGKNVALISEAGMPLISDPGSQLVSHLVARNVPFTVIPGITAATTALIYSGLPFRHFTFYGFLPKKEQDVKKVMTQLKSLSGGLDHHVFIFYESAQRLPDTLTLLADIDPDASVSVSRELTKMFEETVRGKPAELTGKTFKGEIVMVVRFSSTP